MASTDTLPQLLTMPRLLRTNNWDVRRTPFKRSLEAAPPTSKESVPRALKREQIFSGLAARLKPCPSQCPRESASLKQCPDTKPEFFRRQKKACLGR